MVALYATRFLYFFRKHRLLFGLILTWFCGLLTGSGFFFLSEPLFYPQMRSILLQPVSIIGLMFSTFLPLLCTYFSVCLNKPIIIWIVCFFKAVAFSFSFAWIFVFFGSASWLYRLLFMFSDYCFLLALFVLWIRYFFNAHDPNAFDFLLYTVFALFVTAVDYLYVSPFVLGIF